MFLHQQYLLQQVHGRVRERVDFYETDRLFGPDIEAIAQLVLGGDFLVPEFACPSLETAAAQP